MSWLTIGAIVVVIILLVNAGVYFIRQRKLRESGKQISDIVSRKITGTGVVFYTLLLCAFLAGLIVPLAAPSSTFANWIGKDYMLMVYWVWCAFASVPVAVILTLCGTPIER